MTLSLNIRIEMPLAQKTFVENSAHLEKKKVLLY